MSEPGKLFFSVQCNVCEKEAKDIGGTRAKAEKSLKDLGWREHFTFGWCCATCVARSARLSSPVNSEADQP
jgi:hypothetical protein